MARLLRNPESERVPLVKIERDEFLRDYWDYRPGEHVTIIGPTQRGKTTLGFQLLHHTASPELKGHVLASKPRDKTVDQWTKTLQFKKVNEWGPPGEMPWTKNKRRGYVLRPHQTLQDIDADNATVRREFKKCIYDCYGSKDNRILVIDEAHEVQNELKLKKEIDACLMRGAALGCGTWNFIQRSAYNSYHLYSAPEHLFLFNDPDVKNRERFGQIGGVDPKQVEEATHQLGQYEVLYIKRTGPYLCVVMP